MEVIKTIFYFAITVGILILAHEFGHFIMAKISGMRVDIFSVGFGSRLFGKKIGDTDYRISILPLGGYVKIAGMIDESVDTGFIGKEPQPYEFRAKPFHSKFLVITGGVLMNFLLAVIIFWFTFLYQGKNLKKVTEVGYVIPGSIADKSGIRAGDKILSINGKKVKYWDDILRFIYLENLSSDLKFEIEREGKLVSVYISRDSVSGTGEEGIGIIPKFVETVVTAVEPGRPAEKIGLKQKDVIIEADGEKIFTARQLASVIRKNAGKKIKIKWKRNDKIIETEVTPDPDGRIGIQITTVYSGPIKHVNYTVFEALFNGFRETVRITAATIVGLKDLITGKIPLGKGIAGPIRIARIATQSADVGFLPFLNFVAIISIGLALINILPVPGLDGGHLAILLVEGVIRRELPYRVKIAIQQAGIIILLILMALVIYNDIVHF